MTSDPKPDLRFDGRVAVITGAGGGLGRAHSLELARRGAAILVNDLGGSIDGSGASASAAQRVVDEIRALGGQAAANHDSVATAEGGEAIVQAAVDAFGRVDIVVNNAGILRDKAFHKMDAAMVDAVIDVHLKGAFFVSMPAFRLMRAQGYGRIISTTSASGLFGNFGQANYGAAKAGLAGLTRVLALEGIGHGIRANAIAPVAATRMTGEMLGDLMPLLSPETVSPLVAYLAHESCEATGRVFSTAAGRVAEIFIGEGPGFYSAELTPELIAENWDAVTSRDGYAVPESMNAEIGLYRDALA